MEHTLSSGPSTEPEGELIDWIQLLEARSDWQQVFKRSNPHDKRGSAAE